MLSKTAIMEIRKTLGIPESGFANEEDALSWYKLHYQVAKRAEFTGVFGFRYRSFDQTISFDIKIVGNKLEVPIPSSIDTEVPLDNSALDLAREEKLEPWAEAMRLVILVGNAPEIVKLNVPEYFVAPIGRMSVLVHPNSSVRLNQWRRTGEMMGVLVRPASNASLERRSTTGEMMGVLDSDITPRARGLTTVYRMGRMKIGEPLYWETYLAYKDAITERRRKKKENWEKKGISLETLDMITELKPENLGRKGLLRETAKILVSKYHWPKEEESYTIRRYLDRAQKIWNISL